MVPDRKSLRVLLVDDDEFVRSIVSRQLSLLGIESVVTAVDGDTARSELAKAEPFHLILCDLMMPGTDGVALLRDIAKLQPDAGLILMSSAEGRVLRTAEGIARERQLNILGTLAKPVTQQALSVLLGRLEQPAAVRTPRTETAKISADDLKTALACGEIIIHVQPEVHIRDRRLGAVEALARWTSPVLGPIPPDSFIPLAESSGLIRELTDVTLRAGIAACAQWRRQGLDIRISVNLSPFMLEDLSLPETIAALAAEHGLPTRNLLLEVTESGVFRDVATSLDILARLRLRGMSLALDDYGTGHSSLKQLLRVPFTDLKLDRMFLTGSETDPERRRIVESTIVLAHDLGLKVIAEGVETEAQLKLLSELGADYAQGWLIARAMPTDELVDWARNYSGKGQV
jgi:EAL domain-containing protein (putative c-di-GMP-specific phosphodiesterase class I)/FixJ family two-component response regulator